MDSLQDNTSIEQEIADIYARFKALCHETTVIVNGNPMPDAAMQLMDVIADSEAAATRILMSANQIADTIRDEAVPAAVQEAVNAQVGHIFEASSFQDIGAQRIKKVLNGLQTLEGQLERLARHADQRHENHMPKAEMKSLAASDHDQLLNGPQLSQLVPSQDHIDNLFNEQ